MQMSTELEPELGGSVALRVLPAEKLVLTILALTWLCPQPPVSSRWSA